MKISEQLFNSNLEGLPEDKKEFFKSIYSEASHYYQLKNSAYGERDEFKKSNATLAETKTALEKEVERLKGLETEVERLKQFETKVQELNSARINDRINLLPEGELREKAKKFSEKAKDSELVIDFVDSLIQATGKEIIPTSSPGQGNGSKEEVVIGNRRKLIEFSYAEQQWLHKNNKAAYDKLLK